MVLWILIGYMFLFIHRPFEVWPSLGEMHLERVYAVGRHVFRMGIPRLIGVDSAMSDPNSFGGTVVFVLPFVVAFWMSRPSALMRVFLLGYLSLSGLCILLTGSRGSFIGMLLWM